MSCIPPVSVCSRLAIALLLVLALDACSDNAAPAGAGGESASAAAATDAARVAQQQADALAALDADQLKLRGRQALLDKRIYAPSGNNAIEFYIALRAKLGNSDPAAASALADLQPYAVIAAEQALVREDFVEAERLRDLIQLADPQAPSLARISKAIDEGKTVAAERTAQEELARVSALADAEAAAKLGLTPPEPTALSQPTPMATKPVVESTPRSGSVEPVAVAAVTPATTAPAPTAPKPIPAAPAPEAAVKLVALSTPQPQYPKTERHSGTVADVVASFTVNPDGSVSNINAKSIGTRRHAFERSVELAIRRWRFQPISGAQSVTRSFNFTP